MYHIRLHIAQAEDLLKMAAGEDGGAGPPRGVNHGEELLVKLREEGNNCRLVIIV